MQDYTSTQDFAFAGGSRSRVNKAGNNIRKGLYGLDDLRIVDQWRAAHRLVLNSFQAILRNRTRGHDIIVAQRHKRRMTIFGKLKRYEKMQLSRMDDVAGCRLIFRNINELYKFRNKLHKAKFKHKLKNSIDKYDYIKFPKSSGYRGIHDVYSYDVRSQGGEILKGLLVEIQYRTVYQHAWATCVEVVGFITKNQPKFGQGDERFEEILRYASEIIARAWEDSNSCRPDISDHVLVEKFIEMDKELNFMQMLRGLNSAESAISNRKNVILIFGENDDLDIKNYDTATEALSDLFELEKRHPGKDIVLVKGDTSKDVREAFKNYFSDASEFIRLMDDGCAKLLKDKYIIDSEFLIDEVEGEPNDDSPS